MNETEDTVISDSTIVQSCSDHNEHPYYNPEMKDASLVDIDAACLWEISNTTLASGDLDDRRVTQDFSAFPNEYCGKQDVTCKSFVCDGGEVDVFDVTRLQDETIPLPKAQLVEALQENSTTNGSEKPANGLSDVTFKSLNCTGGVIEISDGTTVADETVPLPADQTATCRESYNYGIDPSMFASDQDWKNSNDHLDHHYCKIENYPLKERLSFSLDIEEEVKQISLVGSDSQTGRQEKLGITFSSFSSARSDVEISDGLSQKTSPLLKQAVICQPLDDNSVPSYVMQEHIQDDHLQPNSHVENHEVVFDTDPPAIGTSSLPNTPLNALDGKSVSCQKQEMSKKDSMHPEDNALPLMLYRTESSDCCHLATSPETSTPVDVHMEHVSQVQKRSGSCESNEAIDSALGLSGNGPVLCNSAETLQAENFPGVLKVLSEYPSGASAFQFGILSPVVRRASLAALKAFRVPALDKYGLEGEKSMFAPFNVAPAELWAEHMESPMPRPLFNSTVLGCKPQSEPVGDVVAKSWTEPHPEVEKQVLDIPLIPDGPLQQQLQQMAEFLFLALGKMAPAAVSAPILPPAAAMLPSAKDTSAESHSVCVGTTPVKWLDQSVNTTGQFERKRNISVVDSCTLTDPLLWNLPPGSLECLPRQELEQRLRSSMIMVEALVQQLSACRADGCPSAGPAPSDLRDKLVQTDHSELSQTTMYRDLYLEALSRIGELELNGSSLQNLIQHMQVMRGTMVRLMQNMSFFIPGGLSVCPVVCFQAFSAMDQLRTHCATEVIELERIVGSQQELSAALDQTYPEQVQKMGKHTLAPMSDAFVSSSQLCTTRALLQKTTPMLLKLNEKAASALRERDGHLSARDQAVEEREQIEEEFKEANMNLQSATEQISDLNLQVTILASEMGVLRQKLTEREEERGLLETKVTKLSATVSSTLASYTFLEQALASESTKLQQSWKDIQITTDRANELERSLGQSEQRASEFSQALAQREEQLSQLKVLSQSQKTQIQQLQEVCTQLNGVREMNEFLQVENEFAREQMAESECMLRANLQGLRERNIQCEDLKVERDQLQLENRSLQEELETTRSRADATQLELGQKLSQAVTEIILLHHTLRGLTNELHTKSEPQKESQRRHPSSSFVDSVMVALTAEKEEDVATDTAPGSGTVAHPASQEALMSDEKTVTKLMADIQDTQETLNKHKIDSNELRKEVVELRRSLHQSKVETQFLHEELRKAGSQSANPALFMEEKIQLLREVERLKLSLQEVEQTRVKLLDRAKRHQIVHQTNQQKSENELQMLNKILNKVREVRDALYIVVVPSSVQTILSTIL
uniref:Si:dkey-25o16.4 n=1 Tax=Cyclopterus lumpus TaxID=8103 RepID=A0A8C3FZJ9_CYCLU